MAVALGAIQRDGTTDAFLDGAGRGELLLRRCSRCATVGGPQETRCRACGSTGTVLFPAAGGARVVSWSATYGRGPDGQPALQAVIVIGELDEGPWWWTQVLDAEPPDLATGRRLQVAFAPTENGETLPVFRLA